MRVLTGGLHHESDTFNPIITGEKDIRILKGEEILSHRAEDAITGIVERLEKEGIEVVPTVLARAVPNGVWDRKIYEKLKSEIIEQARKEKIDGICLALHGSMRVEEIGEAEGDLLSSLRSLFPSIPIVCSLDMHATLSKRMLDNADAFTGYKTAPHVDERETGERAAELLIKALNGTRLTMAAYRIPFLVAGEKSETSVEPMKTIMEEMEKLEKEEGILSASILMGFPWADSADGGVCSLTVTDNDLGKAEEKALWAAELFWRRREEFLFYNETKVPEEAAGRIMELVNSGLTPVVISDSGDNPTAGSSQDNTSFLSLLLKEKEITSLSPPLLYQAFYDPEICRMALEKGEGAYIEGELGAYFDKKKSSPIRIRAKVLKCVRNYGSTYKTDLALIHLDGIDVVVTSEHVGCYEVEMMRALSVVPEKRKAIVVKLGYLEPEIRSLSSSSFMALTEGSSDEILERLEYRNIQRPIWPLDKEGDFRIRKL